MSDFLEFFRAEVVGSREGATACTQQQVEALRRVDWICSALGPPQTRKQLVPFLAQVQQQVIERDELLSLLAVQWRTVARVAAADPAADEAEREEALGQCAEALAQLAEMEEKCIRNEAVESLLFLPSLLPASCRCGFVRQRILPLCASLAANESCLFSRCAAARLFPHVLRYADAERTPRDGARAGGADFLVEKRMTQQDSETFGAAPAMQTAFLEAATGGNVADKSGGLTVAGQATESITAKRVEQIFERMCADESLLVRREAIQQLPALVKGARGSEITSACDELSLTALRILREAFGETSDFLRAAATQSAVALATSFPPPRTRLPNIALPQQEMLTLPQSGGSVTSAPVAGDSEKKGIFSVGEVLSLHLLGAADPSWRVRSVAAKEMIGVIRFAPHNFEDVFPSLCILLKDTALRDVRLEAVRCIAQAARVLPQEVVTAKLAPLVRQVLADSVPQSKSADLWGEGGPCAASSGGQNPAFAAAVDAALAVAQKATPTAAKGIAREVIATLQHGDISTAMCIAKRVHDFCCLCQSTHPPTSDSSNTSASAATAASSDEEAAQLVEALCELRQQAGQTSDWRLRLELVKQMPPIANVLGGGFFRTWLSTIFLEALSDPICEVREAAVEVCKELVSVVGSRWAVEFLVPRLVACHEGSVGLKNGHRYLADSPVPASSYLQRIAVQHTLPKLVAVLPRDVVIAQLVPLLIEGLHDSVPNVRLTAAEMLRIVAAEQTLAPTTVGEFVPHLEVLATDKDVDVRFSAFLALEACRAATATNK